MKIDNLYQKLQKSLLYSFKNEAELISSINELIHIFNFQRNKIDEYINSERLISAYVMYFLSTNYKKLSKLFEWLPTELKNTLLKTELVDWGTGPGTFLLAGKQLGFKSCIGIDQSSLMIEQAQKIMNEANLNEGVSYHLTKKESSRTLLFSHSANEMEEFDIREVITKVDPEFILFIEPGTKESFKKLLELRTKLLNQFNIVYPCPSNESCPMGNQEKDWCHQIIQAVHEPEVESLCQKLKRDRRKMPTCFMVFSTKEFKRSENRVLRKPLINKAKSVIPLCRSEVGNNQIDTIELLARDYTKDQKKYLKSIDAGNSLDINYEEKRNNGVIRGKLK